MQVFGGCSGLVPHRTKPSAHAEPRRSMSGATGMSNAECRMPNAKFWSCQRIAPSDFSETREIASSKTPRNDGG